MEFLAVAIWFGGLGLMASGKEFGRAFYGDGQFTSARALTIDTCKVFAGLGLWLLAAWIS